MGPLASSEDFHSAQDLLKVTLEQMLEGIQIIDREWRYIYLNECAVQHAQREKHELLGRTMMECYPGIEKTQMFHVAQKVFGTGQSQQIENFFQYPNGEECWFDVYIEPHPMGVLIRSVDITSRKRIEEQYLHAQRLESIGLLAGGIAHDFSNKLAVMTLYCEMVIADLEKEGKSPEYLNHVLNAIDEATALTRQLLAFGRKQVLNPKNVNLNSLLETAQKGLQKLLGENIQIKTSLEPDLSSVWVDPSQIDQVILNLCINARDAMPKGGVLTLETSVVELDAGYCERRPGVQPGRYVMLAVSDTGLGMSEEVQAKVFEPFFTTKNVGEGTGLGLASVHGIVHQSRGHIWVYSEEGMGTTFKLYFPVVAGEEAVHSLPEIPQEMGGDEKILLVEDDELLLKAFQQTLNDAGYTVFAATGAREAKVHFTDQRGEFDLLLTDVVFSDSTGPQLAADLKAIKPELKCILISGYTENTVAHHGALDKDVVLIQKPISTRKLLSTLRQVLEGALLKGVL